MFSWEICVTTFVVIRCTFYSSLSLKSFLTCYIIIPLLIIHDRIITSSSGFQTLNYPIVFVLNFSFHKKFPSKKIESLCFSHAYFYSQKREIKIFPPGQNTFPCFFGGNYLAAPSTGMWFVLASRLVFSSVLCLEIEYQNITFFFIKTCIDKINQRHYLITFFSLRL